MLAIPLTTRLVIGGLLLALAFLSGAYWQKGRSDREIAELTSAFAAFRGSVDGTARERMAANARQALADIKAKERTDEEHALRERRSRARIDELRRANDSARGGGLPAAPPDSRCPEGQACFDADALERARRELFEEVRRLADEGTAVEDALRAAREWAR